MARKGKEIEVSVAEVVDFLRVTGQFTPAIREVVERKITVEAAIKSGMKVTTAELQKAADAFRVLNDLSKAKDTERWLRSSGISIETLEAYLESNILISKFKEKLEKKAGKAKYLALAGIRESIRDRIYQDWLATQLK